MFMKCMTCNKKFDNQKSRADFNGFCSMKCQHQIVKEMFGAKPKDGGYYLSGHYFSLPKVFTIELQKHLKEQGVK